RRPGHDRRQGSLLTSFGGPAARLGAYYTTASFRRPYRIFGTTTLPDNSGTPSSTHDHSVKGNTSEAGAGLRFPQWRTALLFRLGARGGRLLCRGAGKLATGAQRTGIVPQGTGRK